MGILEDTMRGILAGWQAAGPDDQDLGLTGSSGLTKAAAAAAYFPSFVVRTLTDPIMRGAEGLEKAYRGTATNEDATAIAADFLGGGFMANAMSRAKGSAITNIARSDAITRLLEQVPERVNLGSKAMEALRNFVSKVPQRELDRVEDVFWSDVMRPEVRGEHNYYKDGTSIIRLNQNYAETDPAATLAHELTHARQYRPDADRAELKNVLTAIAYSDQTGYSRKPIESHARKFSETATALAADSPSIIDDEFYSSLYRGTLEDIIKDVPNILALKELDAGNQRLAEIIDRAKRKNLTLKSILPERGVADLLFD